MSLQDLDRDSEREDLRAQAKKEREYLQRYLNHPHPQDPDFPGVEGDEE